MARRFFQVASGAALVLLGSFPALCRAQAPTAQTSSPAASASPAPGENSRGKGNRAFSRENLPPELRKKYDNLPPEQQQVMRENWMRWQNMSPEEKKMMRENEQLRRQKMLQEVEEALKQSGLQLSDKDRDMYVMQYVEERRQIEQKLQKEMEEKRDPLVEALVARLKVEFQSKSVSPTPAPAASSSPSPEASASPSK